MISDIAATRALHRLVKLAKGNTGQSRMAANFLLVWHNAVACGGWDLTDLWNVDEEVAADMPAVAKMVAQEKWYPDAYGLQEQISAIVDLWRPEPASSPPRA